MYTFSRLSGRYVLIGIVLAACALFSYGTANAAKAQEPSPSTPREALALADAVLQALDRNLDITISRQNKQARLTDIIFEQAKFDPSFDLSGRYDRLIAPLNRPIFGLQTGAVIQDEPSFLDQNQSTWKAGFSQNLITGGD